MHKQSSRKTRKNKEHTPHKNSLEDFQSGLEFIQKHISPKFPTIQPDLSEISIGGLFYIYQQIQKYRDSPSLAIQQSDMSKSNFLTELQSKPLYHSIPEEAIQCFHRMDTNTYLCKFKIQQREISLYLAFPKSLSREKQEKRIRKITIWLQMILPYVSSKCSQTLNIYILFTNFLKLLRNSTEPKVEHRKRVKELPNKTSRDKTISLEENSKEDGGGEPSQITPHHANTAFTTSCSHENDIIIYREEEWFKVFIHETFHAFGLDFSHADIEESNQMILSIFPKVDPSTDVRLYETYCEVWAEIIHLLFYERIPGGKKEFEKFNGAKGGVERFKSGERSSKEFEHWITEHIRYEQLFSLYQCKKILRHHHLEFDDLFVEELPYYREITQVFSYYVLKCFIMLNINTFIEWCYPGGPGLSFLSFTRKPKLLQERIIIYTFLVRKMMKTQNYKKLFDKIPDSYYTIPCKNKTSKKKSVRNSKSQCISKTLKMSVFEYE